MDDNVFKGLNLKILGKKDSHINRHVNLVQEIIN